MHLKIQQSEIGRFNRAGTEKSLAFSLKITDSDGCTISQKDSEGNEVKAILKPWRKNEEDGDLEYIKEEYEDLFNNFQINELLSLADLTNYEDDNILFFKIVKENYEEIRNNFIEYRKVKLQKEIDRLNRELENLDIQEDEEIELEGVSKKLESYKSWYEKEEIKLKDCIEGSDTYNKIFSDYQKYKGYYDKLAKKIG